MKLAIVQHKDYQDFNFTELFDKIIDLSDYQPSNSVEEKHEEEISEFEWVLKQITQHGREIDAVIISNLLMYDSEEYISEKNGYYTSAFALALHIRFDQNKTISNLPIVILSFKTIDEVIAKSYEFPQILGTKGTFFCNPNFLSVKNIQTWVKPPNDDLFEDSHYVKPSLQTIQEIIGKCSKTVIADNRPVILKRLFVRNYASSGHDIANEWGAYRMAQIADLKEFVFYYPKTLYFKYLLANIDVSGNNNVTDCRPFYEGNLNVLFIDDFYEKGWEKCLKLVFENKILKSGTITIDPKGTWNDSFLKDIGDNKYDLILLDYYLGKNEKGIDKLKKIKGVNPVVPVIMFTASNKAWNMDKLYEAGADGYYIKEHPDNAHDADFSVENFKNFYETVEKCLTKGKLLRKYWSKINLIKQGWSFTNKGNQKNKERIEERLIMFLGLLKKAYEQTEFDKNTFFYSEWELSFLTLWSTLNEIQEVYYEKHNKFVPFEYTDPSGTLQSKNSHPNGSTNNLPNFISWQIRNGDYLLASLPEFDANQQPVLLNPNFYRIDRNSKYSKIRLDNNTPSGFTVESGLFKLEPKLRYDMTLFIQIAFLIHEITSSETLNRDILMSNLLNLNNKIRNKLYLTHGEESSSLNFTDLYQNHRESDVDWQTHIKQLFEIVYFLCTGKECTW